MSVSLLLIEEGAGDIREFALVARAFEKPRLADHANKTLPFGVLNCAKCCLVSQEDEDR